MANMIINRFDRFINILTILVLVGGGTIVHTLAALTLNRYYGPPWGYISFGLPGLAEAYLIIIQLSYDIYNYTNIFIYFACSALAAIVIWGVKNYIRHRSYNMVQGKG